jgi:hypothetical protein
MVARYVDKVVWWRGQNKTRRLLNKASKVDVESKEYEESKEPRIKGGAT